MVERKCLVNVLEPNGDSKWKKYPIDAAGNVLIRPLQSGQYNETPPYDIEALHKTAGFFGLFKQPYLIYPRLTKKFIKRQQTTLGTVDWEFISRLLKGKALQAYTDETKLGMIDYAVLAGIGILIFYTVVMPNIR